MLATALFVFAGGSMAEAQKPVAQVVKKDAQNGMTVFVIKDAHLYLDTADVKIGDELVINGPLFDAQGEPVGGYLTCVANTKNIPDKNAPKKIKEVTDTSAGGGNFQPHNYIFGQHKDGSYFMQPYDATIRMQGLDADFVIQNGMGLLVNGENICNPNSTNGKTRIAIGYNSRTNELVVADSQAPVTFHALAAEMLKYGADNALYLDGVNNGFMDDMVKNGNLPNNAVKIHIF